MNRVPMPMNEAQVDGLVRVLREVAAERHRQHAKWGEQNHPDGTGLPGDASRVEVARRRCAQAELDGWITYRHITDEEVAEAYAETDPKKLRAELVQTAATFVQWIEAIDRRQAALQQTAPEPNHMAIAVGYLATSMDPELARLSAIEQAAIAVDRAESDVDRHYSREADRQEARFQLRRAINALRLALHKRPKEAADGTG